MHAGDPQPVTTPPHRRLVHLDVLRGFALFGVLLVNFQWFTRPVQTMAVGSDPSLAGVDLVVDRIVHWLAEGKFYPLFSMLFGIGFALMAARAAAAARAFRAVYLRRLAGLALFGAAHVTLAWSGDILVLYAFAALAMLLLFAGTPVTRLWRWGVALIALPATLLALLVAAGVAFDRADPAAAEEVRSTIEAQRSTVLASVESAARVHATGTFTDNVVQRWRDVAVMAADAGWIWLPTVLGFFLLGRWLFESGVLADPAAHRRFLARWRRLGLLAGLPLAALATALLAGRDLFVPTPTLALGAIAATAAGVVLSLGYLSAVVLAADRLRWLAPVGRMALTNYLLQSAVWSLVFYGYGLGLWGQVPRAWHPVLCVGFFALQVAFSRWWLQRFAHGPAEWAWRWLTYLEPPSRRRAT